MRWRIRRMARLLSDTIIWHLMDKWQRLAVTEARRCTQGMHYCNLLVRRNGKNENHQYDWIKHIAAMDPAHRATRLRWYTERTPRVKTGAVSIGRAVGNESESAN